VERFTKSDVDVSEHDKKIYQRSR